MTRAYVINIPDLTAAAAPTGQPEGGILRKTTDDFKPGRVGIRDPSTGDGNDVVEYTKLKEEYSELIKKYKEYEGGYNNIIKYDYRNNSSPMINSFYSKIKKYINNYLYLRDKYINILERFNVYKDNGSYINNSILISKLIDGKFPNYVQVIPKENQKN